MATLYILSRGIVAVLKKLIPRTFYIDADIMLRSMLLICVLMYKIWCKYSFKAIVLQVRVAEACGMNGASFLWCETFRIITT